MSGISAAIIKLFIGKLVEVNTGAQVTNLLFDDFSINQRSVIRGVVKEVIDDAVILLCNIKGEEQPVVINCWNIETVMELKGNGSTKDIYIDDSEGMRRKRK